ncbi:hypothetical protein SAMN05421819_0100 [Bryocella elongata]|uniref:Lysylphosphatidylglycerol synthase TM region n=1 Tax=Bryocella elongata TaxID=863522 RepID=A0A1H5S747_9BACT|nr:lysylphosphatidylglycerol synthase transmembrane domain-containing protein [Bryocella elongata]SEF46463.1 hypothetical protein SAMN05421819_0100 [Bryocella elongata]
MPADISQPQPARRSVLKPALTALLLLTVAALLYLERDKLHFDWHTLLAQARLASLPKILLGIACIYVGYWLRSLRWAILLTPVKRVRALDLLPWQVIGFTIVGLFGRLTDMSRPILIARRTRTPVATQLAIYSIERAFDLGAAAVLFSFTLALAPRSMPHHDAFARAGVASLAGTFFLAIIALSLRFRGEHVARLAGRLLAPISANLAKTVADRLLDFRDGLQALTTLSEFLYVAALSLLMWIGIAAAYFFCTHAFVACPPLATLSVSGIMLLMASSIGGSLLQLPIIGWFTQIAVLAAALHAFFDVPLEVATACGAVIQIAMSLSVVPAGLIFAQITGTGLRAAAHDTSA